MVLGRIIEQVNLNVHMQNDNSACLHFPIMSPEPYFYPVYSDEPGICPSVRLPVNIFCLLHNLNSVWNILMILQLCRTGHDDVLHTKMRAVALILFELSPL